jgi:hypothetical protein
MFFDAESLCHSDNEKNVTKFREKQGKEAVDFFNVTFRGGSSRIGLRNLHYKTFIVCKTFETKRELIFTKLKISSCWSYLHKTKVS